MQKIQTMTLAGAAFVILLGLSACAGHQTHREFEYDSDQPALNAWVDETLIPYLTRQFSRHPRFRGQPILLVRMQGDNVMPRIDELTEQIRSKIADELLKKNGPNLAWRPATEPRLHHDSLHEISCGEDHKIRYYIGIDVSLSKVSRNLYVKIKALNLIEQKWVSGFGQSWTGRPTKDQLESLGREHPDDYLLGKRPLPFSERQPDLLAAYLARNLSCRLRQGEADDLVVQIDPPAPHSPRMIKTAIELLGKYLARFREVEVTDDPSRANVTIISAIHTIDNELHQVWISARQKEGETYLPGAEIEAYVTLESQKETHIADRHQPIPTPSDRQKNNRLDAPHIISSLDLLIPTIPEFCATDSPWESGVQRAVTNHLLPTGSCLAVEVQVKQSAYIFIMSQDARGDLSRIYPSNCSADGRHLDRLQPGELFQFPSLFDPQAGMLELAGAPGTERIYAIAIKTPQLAAIFADHMKELKDLCRSGLNYPATLAAKRHGYPHERIRRWQAYLNWLSKKNSGLLEWREFRFQHEGL